MTGCCDGRDGRHVGCVFCLSGERPRRTIAANEPNERIWQTLMTNDQAKGNPSPELWPSAILVEIVLSNILVVVFMQPSACLEILLFASLVLLTEEVLGHLDTLHLMKLLALFIPFPSFPLQQFIPMLPPLLQRTPVYISEHAFRGRWGGHN